MLKCTCIREERTPITFAYSIRMSPPRNRKAIQFASGHSAQLACSVGQSFSCNHNETPWMHAETQWSSRANLSLHRQVLLQHKVI